MIKNTKIADIITIFIILIPVLLFSLHIIIGSDQKPNILNTFIYLILIITIYVGTFIRVFAGKKRSKVLWVLSFVLTALGILTPIVLALFILKDIVSLALVALILIPIFLVF